MRTIVKGKNLDVSDADHRYVQQKMQRLERLLDDRSEALVELSIERHKNDDESHLVEVTLVIDGAPLRGVARANSHHAAADAVIDRLERRAVDHKQRPRIRRRRPIEEKALLRSLADGTADLARDGGPQVVKVKRFAIEPMFEEDAMARMQELGHSFFVFVNAENERIAVLYRRQDGHFGLIEPSVGGAYTSGNAGDARSR
ncbi:MAG: ribosome-associated translation inhibitor RaiA [Chloroflexi bacterium]|nr:ribosome-associated translation inhibitor RaiA [Chloroflexota bacterium]HEV8053374.1 ribosome-associated translation inhibitor RaiA [Candidatus Limnocylindrales bacterium]